ncbi:carbonic anhydrase 4-like isoform X3 [Ictalurus furcatus]|uniref:carbonic anhydrase 4-like isoform X3 n=1 Tax=Ictalurus furcatus TaxID=66913 RepID=UPI00234FFED9|nr:carbonic anhydrase 4-like isoform X3 [Ictalurus furcatus]
MRNLLLCLVLVLVFKSCLSEDWCYQSQMSCDQPCKGPAAWNEVNSVCGGNRQSPINIVTKKTKKESSLTAFKFTGYDKIFTSMLKNNGRTVSLDIPLGATVSGGNLLHTYNAIQLHFHWGNNGSPGSEHTLDGEQYPMELHILHLKDTYIAVEDALNDTTGQAILGFFFETEVTRTQLWQLFMQCERLRSQEHHEESDSENKEYSAFIAALAQVQDAEGQAELAISLNSLILSERMLGAYYRYEGSETTPGCSESVIWTMFEQPIPLSRDQLAAFSTLKFNGGKPMVDTFRPVQPRKGRVVYRSHSGAAIPAMMFSFFLVMLRVFLALCLCNFY